MTNHSLVTADRATHLKIVVVALLASVTVMVIGISTRPQIDTGATTQVVKISHPVMATRGDAVIR
jgi:hypothetical protein